jgi:Flp pilus assembly protein TadG
MKLSKKLQEFKADESAIALMIGVAMVPLFFAFGALAMDGGNVMLQINRLQNTADSAALWGASHYSSQLSSDGEISNYINKLSQNTGVKNLTVSSPVVGFYDLTKTPNTTGVQLSCPSSSCASAVQVTIRADVNTFLGSLLGKPSFAIAKTATAITGAPGQVDSGNLCNIAVSQCLYEKGRWAWSGSGSDSDPVKGEYSKESKNHYDSSTCTPDDEVTEYKLGAGHGDEEGGSRDGDDDSGRKYKNCKRLAWFTNFSSGTTPDFTNWTSSKGSGDGLDDNNRNAKKVKFGDVINLNSRPSHVSGVSNGKYGHDLDRKWFTNAVSGNTCWVAVVDDERSRRIVGFSPWKVTKVCDGSDSAGSDNVYKDGNGRYRDSDSNSSCDYGDATDFSAKGTFNNKSKTIVLSTGDYTNFSIGQIIKSSTGIPSGTKITAGPSSCTASACTYTMSNSATETKTGQTITAYAPVHPYVAGTFVGGISRVPGGTAGSGQARTYSVSSPVLVRN